MDLLKDVQFLKAVFLLILSNIFMTFAWYGHLKYQSKPLTVVILVSWAIAFFEYCLQVPANRLGVKVATPAQLKVTQEVVTLVVFALFSIFYLKALPDINDYLAFGLIVLAVFVAFSKPF